MSVYKRVKTPAKMFTSDLGKLEKVIINTMDKISDIVGSSLGPGGRVVIIESELPEIPNTNTKDGVTIFRALGAQDAYEHLIIEQTRDSAVRTVSEAGDGTTTATVIASALTKSLFNFCKNNRKYSPQKVTRIINKILKDQMLPAIEKASIKINGKNKSLLEKVATVSANGDSEMARSVIEAFDQVGYAASSHVTIQELSGPTGYKVNLIEGFPINKGYEESIGKFHPAFINDQIHQRCVLEKPLFILFDGRLNDSVQVQDVLARIGEAYVSGASEFKNVVIIAHSFGDSLLGELAFNFSNPGTINVLPLSTPMDGMINSQLHFLMDLSAFTGAKIFGMNNPLTEAGESDFGANMEKIEVYRFRTTIVGEPDELNIEVRSNELMEQAKQAASRLEASILSEKLAKLTSGIAQLQIFGSSNGELKERSDRAEDAVCAVRAAITSGCLPGGCRTLINLATELGGANDIICNEILIPALLAPFHKLLENAGYNPDEIEEIKKKLIDNPEQIFDVENGVFGAAKELGIFDATAAVSQALKNAVSIASVMGTLGGIIAAPRDNNLENQYSIESDRFQKTLDNAGNLRNEANERP